METCKLCTEKPADKKGSHIVPHFLLKRIENIDGKTERDYELGFTIGSFDTKSHFGRALQPEKLEEVYGELSDYEIANNSHPLVVDNFFCSNCEKRFSVIESEYSKTLNVTSVEKYNSGASSEVGLLFWISVLWRMSINNKSGVQFSKNKNEKLRRILNNCLVNSIKELEKEKVKNHKDIQKMSYKLVRCPNYSDSNSTFLVFHPNLTKPYSLLIDEYVLLFSFKNDFNQYSTKDFFGLKSIVFDAEINTVDKGEMVLPVSSEFFKNMNNGLINHMKSIRMNLLDQFFNKVHVAAGGIGEVMPENIRNQIMTELTSKEKKLGRKYTIEDLRESTYKIMKNYAP